MSNRKYDDNYHININNLSDEMKDLSNSYPVSNYQIINMNGIEYIDPNSIYLKNPQNFIISNYKERSRFESNIIEFWAPITNFIVPNIISDRYYVSTYGRSWNRNTRKPFGLAETGKGYLQGHFSTTNGTLITRKFHRIIMMTFSYFPGCEDFLVNHRDSIRSDNRIWNLEWCTESENTKYGINHGFKKVFGNNYTVKLSDEEVYHIMNLYKSGYSAEDIISILNIWDKVDIGTLKLICTGKNRQSITRKFYN